MKSDIYVTVGPRSWGADTMRGLLAAGVVGFRFPFSKETPEAHHDRCVQLRRLEIELRLDPSDKLIDLPGNKPRLDNLSARSVARDVEYFVRFAPSSVDDGIGVDFSISPLLSPGSVEQSSEVVIGDDDNRFIVDDVEKGVARGRFAREGVLQPTRAFWPAGADLRLRAFTATDKELLARAGLPSDFSSVGLSFVEDPSDVETAREWLLEQFDWKPRVVAKIETARGVVNASAIADVSDCVMIGRGDLAVDVGVEGLWWAQRAAQLACAGCQTYMIVATGFLDGLDSNQRVTRSQSIDIGTALAFGANAILLSAETTIGDDPVAAVRALRRHMEAWEAQAGLETGPALRGPR